MILVGVAILYNPDDSFYSNMLTYLHELTTLIIFDNSPQKLEKKSILENPKIDYYWDGINEGIARRINQAIAICKKQNFEFLLTMDQDSSFDENDLKKYKEFVEDNKNHRVGMYGILHHISQQIDRGRTYSINQLLITSGSIIPISTTDLIGKFDENLFIDGVDTEYCLRIFNMNMQTILFNEITLRHQIGSPIKKLTPFLTIEERKIHHPRRMYYITRNFFYIRKKYLNTIFFNKKEKKIKSSIR